jgi:hypothetical protein
MTKGHTRYAVEIESLADFHAFVDREISTALEPRSSSVRADLLEGRHWGGALRTGMVRAARLNYGQAHSRADANLGAYLRAGATMLEVIKVLMENYRTTEDLARLSVEDVLRLFDEVAERQAADTPTRTIFFAA